MPESALYGKSRGLVNVRVLKHPDYVGMYNVFVDGTELHGVTALDVSFRPGDVPQAVVTLNSVPKIDHDLMASFRFEPYSIRECMKFLSLQLQLDTDLHDAWKSSIFSALRDLEGKEDICDYDRAEYILERLIS